MLRDVTFAEKTKPPLHLLDLAPNPSQLPLHGQDVLELARRVGEVLEQGFSSSCLFAILRLEVDVFLGHVLRVEVVLLKLAQPRDLRQEGVEVIDRHADLPGRLAAELRVGHDVGLGNVAAILLDQLCQCVGSAGTLSTTSSTWAL